MATKTMQKSTRSRHRLETTYDPDILLCTTPMHICLSILGTVGRVLGEWWHDVFFCQYLGVGDLFWHEKSRKNPRKSNERPGPAQNKIVRSCKRARVHTHTNFGVCMSSTTKVSFLPILPHAFTVQTRSRPYQKIKFRGFNLSLQF